MKKIILILLMTVSAISAQNDSVKVYKTGLYVGGGISYPRYMTITEKSIASHANLGAFFNIGFNITEHFGFRLSPNYILLSSFYYGPTGKEIDNYVNMATLNLEAVFNLLPCQRISPYVLIGYGATYFKSTNPYLGPLGDRTWIKDSYSGYQAEFGLGAEFKMWDDISIKAEFDYITASNNKIDGNEHTNEVKGILQSNGDSYMNLNFGLMWHFFRGQPSNICNPPQGIREVIVYKEVPVERIVIDTVYINNTVVEAVEEKKPFVIENVRFQFDKDLLTDEAKGILSSVADVLKKYPETDFEILGHTDNIGSDKYNLDLSKRRAIAVKKYLVITGIDATRLHTAGCGERKPVADNSTEAGRAINRRIEFSIFDGTSSKCPDKANFGTTGSILEKAIINNEQIVIEGIHFKFDSDVLTSDSKNNLDNAAKVLTNFVNTKVEIQGHTDNQGSDSYNKKLSNKRASAVKKYLVSKGVNKDNLSTVGLGESTPLESNSTAYGRAVNRRIEFNILNESKIKIKQSKPNKVN